MCGQGKIFGREAFSPSHTFTWLSLFALVIRSPGKGTYSISTVNVHSSIRHFVDVLPALVVVAVLFRAVVVKVNVVTAAIASLASFAATPVKTRER